MSSTLIDPKKHRQLFLDDYAIEHMIGVKRSLHQPEKSCPVIRPDQSLGESSIQTRSAPQWNSDKEVWEWWYSGNKSYYATSKDLEHWESTPVDRAQTHIIRDENDKDPKRRYKALSGDGSSNE